MKRTILGIVCLLPLLAIIISVSIAIPKLGMALILVCGFLGAVLMAETGLSILLDGEKDND